MTQREGERLARVETQIVDMKEDIKEMKDSLNSLPDELMKKLDERYAQKSELAKVEQASVSKGFVAGVFGAFATLFGIALSIWHELHN